MKALPAPVLRDFAGAEENVRNHPRHPETALTLAHRGETTTTEARFYVAKDGTVYTRAQFLRILRLEEALEVRLIEMDDE